jgi:hypothetical protein
MYRYHRQLLTNLERKIPRVLQPMQCSPDPVPDFHDSDIVYDVKIRPLEQLNSTRYWTTMPAHSPSEDRRQWSSIDVKIGSRAEIDHHRTSVGDLLDVDLKPLWMVFLSLDVLLMMRRIGK